MQFQYQWKVEKNHELKIKKENQKDSWTQVEKFNKMYGLQKYKRVQRSNI